MLRVPRRQEVVKSVIFAEDVLPRIVLKALSYEKTVGGVVLHHLRHHINVGPMNVIFHMGGWIVRR